MTDAVRVDRLMKRYRAGVPLSPPRVVLDGLSFTAPAGEITALLGHNGAGKSTAARILLGLARPDAGTATVLGRDAVRARGALQRDVAYVPASRRVFGWMRVADFVAGVAHLCAGWDAAIASRLMGRWELDEHARLRELSTGGRSRLLLLVALARRAPLLVLDEPTSGLDPAAVEDALSELVGAVADGATVLLVTHRLEEVERIADRVVVMHRGRAELETELDALRVGWRAVDVVGHAEPAQMQSWPEVARVTTQGEGARLLVRDAPDGVVARVRMLGADVTGVRPLSLREVYLAVTGAAGAADAARDDLA